MNKNVIFLLIKSLILISLTYIVKSNIIGSDKNCSQIKSFNSSEINSSSQYYLSNIDKISRRLTLDYDWETGVSVRTKIGEVPWVPCPVGYYRIIKNKKLNHRVDGCIPCPAGRYGSTIGLTSSRCSAPCPVGRFGDFKGASNPDDCTLCPLDTYGASEGLTSPTCSGKCPIGTYNPNFGSTKFSDCVRCPPNYFGNQCSEQLDFGSYLQSKLDNQNNKIDGFNQFNKQKSYQSSSNINSYAKNTNKCGGLNNVCKTQHVVSFM